MEKIKSDCILLFSGGFDSVVLLYHLLDQGKKPLLLHFDYNQRSRAREFELTLNWAVERDLDMFTINLPQFTWSKSSVLFHNQDEGGGNDYLESRNLIFIAYASSLAQAKGITEIYTGFIGPEHYPDTSPTFLKAIDTAVETSCGVDVFAPFVHWGKTDLFNYAVEKGWNVPYILRQSFSCNVPVNGHSCGECKDCKARELYSETLKGKK